ncbi:hypothetical protein KR054_001889 [Drosophila jambulina]|nr:hypothetical protein KR054_001889 [Drosophila jambulina]
MSHLPLDARAILQYLNDLGYRNISAEQLREFLKDLRKLIKHEERMAENARANHSSGSSSNLHQRGTVSSRAKLSGDKGKDKENAAAPSSSSKEMERQTDQEQDRSNGGGSANELARLFKEKLLMEASIPPPGLKDLNASYSVARGKRRSRSRTRQEREPPLSSGGESDRNADLNRMQRRRRSKSHPRSATRGSYLGKFSILSRFQCALLTFYNSFADRRRGKAKNCDPVALFQYYQKEWAHFRSQIPGESSHSNARFEVRQKLMDLK